MEKGRGKGTDTLKKDNDFVRRGDVKRLLENTVCLHEELPAQIDIIPSADVWPVVHGHWDKIMTVGIDLKGQCSNCGVWSSPSPYCPNCGARMDSKGDTDV